MTELNTQNVKNKASNLMIEIDAKDFQQICPVLKSLQQNTALVLKDYHGYLQNKERRSVGIPYNLIRKFQIIKNILNQAQNILNFQCRFYRNAINNRECEKTNQQHFFVQTMKSYDQRRLEMKAYILKMERQMQIIEDEVKKDIDYQTHKFTQYWSQISLDRLEHNFLNKMNAVSEVKSTLRKNTALRKMVQTKIDCIKSKQSNTVKESSSPKKQFDKLGLKQNPSLMKTKGTALRIQQNIYKISSFLNSYLIKQTLCHQRLTFQLKQLQNYKIRIQYLNKRLRNGIDRIQKDTEAKRNQYAIIYELNRSIAEDRAVQGKTQNINKTDFLIYMQQMQRYVQQRINKYGWSSFQSQKGRYQHLPNHPYSKSCQKMYKVEKQPKSLQNYINQKQITALKQYRDKSLDYILKQRILRRQMLQNQESSQHLELQNKNNQSLLIQQIQHQCQQLQSELINNKLDLSLAKAQQPASLILNQPPSFSNSLEQQEQSIQSN